MTVHGASMAFPIRLATSPLAKGHIRAVLVECYASPLSAAETLMTKVLQEQEAEVS